MGDESERLTIQPLYLLCDVAGGPSDRRATVDLLLVHLAGQLTADPELAAAVRWSVELHTGADDLVPLLQLQQADAAIRPPRITTPATGPARLGAALTALRRHAPHTDVHRAVAPGLAPALGQLVYRRFTSCWVRTAVTAHRRHSGRSVPSVGSAGRPQQTDGRVPVCRWQISSPFAVRKPVSVMIRPQAAQRGSNTPQCAARPPPRSPAGRGARQPASLRWAQPADSCSSSHDFTGRPQR
ncbi:hypothetical protein ACTOB_008028 [Actinoplanes oblitus]|uniref:Uncharacterized protein n=1 Tax=Actinoplanes oblitus TaxID=3040509 RepID=A0ABY8WDZ6_9ACTN|nr:hypothetical protein [Actinoplanes oblitus]WIM95888.1 hypothetical protein ACTOB_008028 [Actinoplanes oblitus]